MKAQCNDTLKLKSDSLCKFELEFIDSSSIQVNILLLAAENWKNISFASILKLEAKGYNIKIADQPKENNLCGFDSNLNIEGSVFDEYVTGHFKNQKQSRQLLLQKIILTQKKEAPIYEIKGYWKYNIFGFSTEKCICDLNNTKFISKKILDSDVKTIPIWDKDIANEFINELDPLKLNLKCTKE